jgi:succinoglycan biosynthesis transport protein ExoP
VKIDEYELTPRDYIAILKRRRGAFFGALFGVLLVAIAFAALLPSIYRATATILIEQQEIPPELVRSTITSYADQRIQTINQRVMTGDNLLALVQKFDLFPDKRDRLAREELLDKIRENVSMKIVSADVMDPRRGVPTKATIAFTLGFDDPSPTKAHRVANELTSLYLNENLRSRTALANDTSVFLSGEADRLAKQVADLETKLAAFKEEHVSELPELLDVNRQLYERTDRELDEVRRSLRTTEDRKVYLQSELALQNPYQTLFSETGERLLSPADRVKSLESQLAGMVGLYSEQHPEVIRTRETLAGLKAEISDADKKRDLVARIEAKKAELASIKQRYSDEHPEVKVLTAQINALIQMMSESVGDAGAGNSPTNPAYVQLKSQLDSVELERQSLVTNQQRLRTKLEELEARLQSSPRIEKQYRELSRNLQTAQTNYLDVKSKTAEAQLSQSLETDRKGERFTLIDPAQMPEKPVSPNRVLILTLGLVLAFMAGFVTVFAYESIEGRVFGAPMVMHLLGTAPIGVIPVIWKTNEISQARRSRLIVLAGAVGAVAVAAAVVHFFVMPLDTAWFVFIRRYGL